MRMLSAARSTAVLGVGLSLFIVGSSLGQVAPGPRSPISSREAEALVPVRPSAALRTRQFETVQGIAGANGTADIIVQIDVPKVGALRLQACTAEDQAAAVVVDANLSQTIAAVAQTEIARLAGTTHQVHFVYKSIPFVALTASPEAIAILKASPVIVGVNEDRLSRPMLDNTVNIVGAPAAWAEGFDGSGSYVAILDTGILASHPFFAGKDIRQACFARGENGQGNCPNGLSVDTSSADAARHPVTLPHSDHGTHVTGIACGNDPSFPLFGVARNADIIAVQVFSQFASQNAVLSFTSDQIGALEFVFSLRNTLNISSINMSLGGGQFLGQGSCDSANSAEKAAIDNLRAVGIATVIAAGNDGFCPGLSAPGCISTAVAVGATTDSDVEAGFSNFDPVMLDVYAPGVDVLSSLDPSISGVGLFAEHSGTSMATPHVTGAWAILKQASFGEGVTAILQALQTTGDPVSSACAGTPAQLRINVINALQTLSPIAQPCTLNRVTPTPPAAGDEAGTSVAMRGDVAVVGAPLRNAATGEALVLRRNSVDWPLEQVLTASDGLPGDVFGQAVGVDGDVAVVGAMKRGGSGAVYVYRWNGAVWQEVQILTASDATVGDEFGAAVVVRGDVIAVGARARDCGAGADCGAVYAYRFDGSSWTAEQVITASDASASARFGFAVDADNTRVLVGAPNKGCGSFSNCGLAYSYEWDGTAWVGQVKLQGFGLGPGDSFGKSVALDGDFALVGSPQDDPGAPNAGSVYLFQRSGAAWTQLNRLNASDPTTGAQFGSAVALDIAAERLVLGAVVADSPGASGAGAVYVFRKNVTGWVELGKVTTSGVSAGDQFGGAVATNGTFAIAGARLNDLDAVDAGAAFVDAIALDCNRTGLADACDVSTGASEDCNGNAVPDSCEGPLTDCNNNTIGDGCDIRSGTSLDCNANQVPDECEAPQPDCNNNAIADGCDIMAGTSVDCNFDFVPDECQPDADCNANTVRDICDIGSGFSLDCNANLVPDDCDIAAGARDNNLNGIPDECECFLATAPSLEQILDGNDVLVASVKNRFLSFSGGDAGRQQAVRVKFVSLPGAFNVFDGTTAWVALPQPASELPGKGLTDPVGSEDTFMGATLVDAPVFADWSTFGTVHVFDERIIPTLKLPGEPIVPAVYDIQLMTTGCDVNFEVSFSPPAVVTNPRWGDLAQLVAGQFRAPDGVVSVDDMLAILAKFTGAANAPIKPRVELLGVTTGPDPRVDGKITVVDLLQVLSAFVGGSYPFPPSP